MTTIKATHEAFKKDLRELLKKHKAELYVEEFGALDHIPGVFEMVVDFAWDEKRCKETGCGSIEQLNLGEFID